MNITLWIIIGVAILCAIVTIIVDSNKKDNKK